MFALILCDRALSPYRRQMLARREALLALERCEIPIIRAKGRHSRKRISLMETRAPF
jgi:hypothetical protein